MTGRLESMHVRRITPTANAPYTSDTSSNTSAEHVMRLWRWLNRNKDGITATSNIVQAIAVALGVFFAVNEFVLKDRQGDQARVDRAFEIFKSQVGSGNQPQIGDYFIDVVAVDDPTKSLFDSQLLDTEEVHLALIRAMQRYTEIQTCLKTQTCDEPTIRHLFCGEAFYDSFVAYKIAIKPPKWAYANYDERLDNLFDFTLECMNHHLSSIPRTWKLRRSENWDPVLGKAFAQLEEKWRKAILKTTKDSR